MALFKRKTTGKKGEWFYCLRHRKVEEGPECPAKDRFGPYATPAEAARAMETAQERNLQWQTDPRWHDQDVSGGADDGDGDGDGDGGGSRGGSGGRAAQGS